MKTTTVNLTRSGGAPERQAGRQFYRLALFCGLIIAATPIAQAAIESAVPVRTSAPEFPYEMKREGLTGVVTVVFSVDEKGNVVEPAVLKSSNKGFDQAALEAIARWKFKPARQDGVAVRSKLAIPIQFIGSASD